MNKQLIADLETLLERVLGLPEEVHYSLTLNVFYSQDVVAVAGQFAGSDVTAKDAYGNSQWLKSRISTRTDVVVFY